MTPCETDRVGERAMTIAASIPDQLGQFQVLGLLGTGGMGEVFLGRRLGPGGFSRAVVLKRLLPHLARSAVVRKMFLDEARIVARIRHRNVVQVQELGEDGDQLFFAMEYLEGETLSQLVRQRSLAQVPIPYQDAAFIMAEIAAGLHAAHTLIDGDGRPQNVVHRDVTLSNVFVTYDGQVKLIDFGIAKAEDRLQKTESGLVRGTTAYLSPEQIRGRAVDRRTDIWSFGVVLYEMTTLRRLFKRTTVHQTHEAILRGKVVPPWELDPNYPRALAEICLRCLRRRPDERYPDCAALRADMQALVETLPSEGRPDERVAGMMRQHFGRRMAAQRRMLQRLERGESGVEVVAPSTDSDLALEAVDGGIDASASDDDHVARTFEVVTGGPTIATSSRVTSLRRSVWPAWAAFFSIATLVAGITAWWLQQDRLVTSAPAPRTQIRIETVPSGANVIVSGSLLGVTPMRLDVPDSRAPLLIALQHEGYETHAMTIVPNTAADLLVELKPTGSRTQPARSLERPAPHPSPAPALKSSGGPRSSKAPVGQRTSRTSNKTRSSKTSAGKRPSKSSDKSSSSKTRAGVRSLKSSPAKEPGRVSRPTKKAVTPPSGYQRIDDWQDF